MLQLHKQTYLIIQLRVNSSIDFAKFFDGESLYQ